MPTMPKLISAFLLGALGFFAAGLVAGHLPPERPEGMMRPVVAFFGAVIGWRFMGKRVGGGWNSAMGFGLSSAVLLAIVSLFWFAGVEMLRRSLRKAYGGNPFEALEDMFQIAFDLLEFLNHADVIGALVVGGIVCGLVAEAVARRWN